VIVLLASTRPEGTIPIERVETSLYDLTELSPLCGDKVLSCYTSSWLYNGSRTAPKLKEGRYYV